MLRKLIMFAITSGLAKKAWDSYRRKQNPFPTQAAARLSCLATRQQRSTIVSDSALAEPG